MSKEKQIESTDWLTRGIPKEQLEREKREAIMSADLQGCITYDEWSAREYGIESVDFDATAEKMVAKGYRKQSEWISVEERLPTENEYLTHHNDGLDTFKRITVAYMTDTIEYTIGCYDGYKWMNQLGNKKINDVVAWKPFELYEAPKGGAE